MTDAKNPQPAEIEVDTGGANSRKVTITLPEPAAMRLRFQLCPGNPHILNQWSRTGAVGTLIRNIYAQREIADPDFDTAVFADPDAVKLNIERAVAKAKLAVFALARDMLTAARSDPVSPKVYIPFEGPVGLTVNEREGDEGSLYVKCDIGVFAEGRRFAETERRVDKIIASGAAIPAAKKEAAWRKRRQRELVVAAIDHTLQAVKNAIAAVKQQVPQDSRPKRAA